MMSVRTRTKRFVVIYNKNQKMPREEQRANWDLSIISRDPHSTRQWGNRSRDLGRRGKYRAPWNSKRENPLWKPCWPNDQNFILTDSSWQQPESVKLPTQWSNTKILQFNCLLFISILFVALKVGFQSDLMAILPDATYPAWSNGVKSKMLRTAHYCWSNLETNIVFFNMARTSGFTFWFLCFPWEEWCWKTPWLPSFMKLVVTSLIKLHRKRKKKKSSNRRLS